MKTEYQYLSFDLYPEQPPNTSRWYCRNRRSQNILAIVEWYPAWRQYCFFPAVQAVYNAGCLRDITDFLTSLGIEQKAKLAAQRLPKKIVA